MMNIHRFSQQPNLSVWRKPRAVICLVLLCAMATAMANSRPLSEFKVTTVYLVRHAEKAAEPAADPPLTEAGKKRAEELAHKLSQAGIKTIFTSQYLRTKQTAGPLAKLLGITATVVPVNMVIPTKMSATNARELSPKYLAEMVERVNSSPGDVLIAGHSNTVPELIKALGGDIIPTIDESEYGDLFVVTVYAKGKAKVAHLKQ
ncbi:MAG: histidine phosphatase family protein [Blastocatellales bacterium]